MSHHRVTTSPKKIVVIGAGMAGLACAARLAKRGHRVSIIEATEFAGGKCRTEWIDGYAFDTGPSLLTLPAVYRDLFLKTGKRLEHLLELQPVDPSFSYIFHDGKTVTFPNLSHNATVSAISSAFGESAGRQWHELLRRAEAMWESSRESFIEGELKSPLQLLKRRSFIRDLRTIAPWTSLSSLTDSYTDNPYLKKIISRYATYTGSDPRQVPAVLLTIVFVEEAFGAWHVKGGLGSLASTLESRVRDLGVDIRFNAPVKSIDLENGIARGVTLKSGESIQSDVIVANADASIVYNSLLPQTRKTRSPRAALRKATPSLSGFSLLLGLRGTSSLGHHTVYFPENYDDEFDDIFDKKRAVKDPTIYLCAPQDPLMVKREGTQAISILVNSPRHQPKDGFDWSNQEFNQKYAEKIIDLIESRGITIRPHIVEMHIRSPYDLQNQVLAPGGSIYGTSSNGLRSTFLRAKNRSPLKNLYCVGGSAHPGGGLPLVGLSSEIVALAVLDKSSS